MTRSIIPLGQRPAVSALLHRASWRSKICESMPASSSGFSIGRFWPVDLASCQLTSCQPYWFIRIGVIILIPLIFSAFFELPKVGGSTENQVVILVCTPSRGQRNKSKKYLNPLSNKGHAFPTVSERQGYAGDV